MEINLDIPVNVGDSIFFNDVMRSEARIVEIHIRYKDYSGQPDIILEWAQWDVGLDVIELWDEGEINLSQLGVGFWLTYEDMLRANRSEQVEYQIACDNHLKRDYGQEMDRCNIKEKIGCDGCAYIGRCEYENK